MLFLLAIPAWAGSLQFTATGFVSFGLGRGLAIGYGADVGFPYVAGGVNYPDVAPTVGPFARFGLGDARGIIVGARGGLRWAPGEGELYATPQLELAAAFRGLVPPAPHLGALVGAGWPGAGPHATARLSWEFVRESPARATADVGFGVLGYLAGGGRVTAGRPLRDSGALVLPAAHASSQASSEFVEAARSEWASVPAFLRLAAELHALGAPGSLVGRALQAARDEIRHVGDCLTLAGGRVQLGPLPMMAPRTQRRREWLSLIAEESELDGVIGEGSAARGLEELASSCRNDHVARRLARMAGEENAHATLAKDVVSWARRE